MKTLAEFKRAIHTGMEIECTEIEERRFDQKIQGAAGEYFPIAINEKMKGPRYVSHVNTTGFYLKRADDKSAHGSFCNWPKASDLEYNGNKFTVTERDSHGGEWQKRHYKIVIK